MKFSTSMKWSILMVAIALSGSAYAKKDKVNYEGVMKTIPHTVINFNPNSIMLSTADESALRKMIHDARAKGEINDVAVAAWSDRALPSEGASLLSTDRDLARARAETIAKFLKTDMEVAAVDSYNMAEDSNWLARTFNTEDAKLKKVFSKRASRAPVTKAEFQIIKNEGGPSEAIVLVERAVK